MFTSLQQDSEARSAVSSVQFSFVLLCSVAATWTSLNDFVLMNVSRISSSAYSSCTGIPFDWSTDGTSRKLVQTFEDMGSQT